jgi:hypothetical protein|tara:strand:- start:9064 stop:9348 length:285 start_codon:yes stop_codon:yes gene_type:complete
MPSSQNNESSYLTPGYLNGLVERYGFNSQLKGGDFNGAKQDVLQLTQGYHFRNPRHKYLCTEAIKKSWNMEQLYTALYNLMHAKNNPSEKLSAI